MGWDTSNGFEHLKQYTSWMAKSQPPWRHGTTARVLSGPACYQPIEASPEIQSPFPLSEYLVLSLTARWRNLKAGRGRSTEPMLPLPMTESGRVRVADPTGISPNSPLSLLSSDCALPPVWPHAYTQLQEWLRMRRGQEDSP